MAMLRGVSLLVLCVGARGFDFLKPKYWKDQILVTKLLSGVPKGSKVLEIDASDAKNLYYLPIGCDVTQWYETSPKDEDRAPVTLAANKLGLAVKVTLARGPNKAPRLEAASYDAAFCVRALGRASERGGADAARTVVDAALECVKPGDGVFYFLEDAKNEALLASVLDDHPLVADCEATVENESIVGYVRTPMIAERGGGMASPKMSRSSKKKR